MVDKDYGASPPDSANSLWYRSKTNWFEDEDGTIIYDLSEFFAEDFFSTKKAVYLPV